MIGPAVVITIGVLFLLHEMHGGNFDIGNTYPVILIVIGVISLASALAPMDGHVSRPVPGPPPAATPAAPSGVPQPPLPGQGQ
jgi:Domain of unknown function (DUF5668)